MYFCLKCEELHQNSTARKILTTGFRTIISTMEKHPLGICITSDQMSQAYSATSSQS
ncbi:DUF3973 domain-containing protein [Ammoniphilus sp. YIM 78166]|uniref:DUF3973 domain-containing protein n=1 Tax=Ammoniphilus sp. YIM 78166 TaxID=1644106 RepID=UPI001430F278